MSELLPTIQADRIRRSLIDYLTTTFALSDADARDGLDRFLSDADTGMFKGPYVRLRLPFRPADGGLARRAGLVRGVPTPYGHQAAAFTRLASATAGGQRRRPLPTLVTTGTGSGKTEAFLYPILDHVLRAKRDGRHRHQGADPLPDERAGQRPGPAPRRAAHRARRTRRRHRRPLHRAAAAPPATTVTADGLITDRAIIRDTAPDILLTNYKMLDQLLLRHDDQRLWRAVAPTSLQYLVLDEFHTYDGAQGTDVAMLLRRLGLALKSHWPDDDPTLTDDDRARPLAGSPRSPPPPPSGDKGDPAAMLGFAETVFGEPFDARLRRHRVPARPRRVGRRAAAERVAARGCDTGRRPRRSIPRRPCAALDELGDDPDGSDVAARVLGLLYDRDARDADARPAARPGPRPPAACAASRRAPATPSPSTTWSPASSTHGLLRPPRPRRRWVRLFAQLVAALGHVRAVGRPRRAVGRGAPVGPRAHPHRPRRRLRRPASAGATTARPSPATTATRSAPSFPAVYCRHCGRSGWGVGLAPVGDEPRPPTTSTSAATTSAGEGRFRALLYAAAEAERELATARRGRRAGLVRRPRAATLQRRRPDADDPDLARRLGAARAHPRARTPTRTRARTPAPPAARRTPSASSGSAIATLLSVSLSHAVRVEHASTPREKKALVFTDSVQDAAHRAGFVQARSHTLTLRARAARRRRRRAAAAGRSSSTRSSAEAGDDPFARYRLLPPDCADRDSFAPSGRPTPLAPCPPRCARRVRQRLALDAALEFGLNSRHRPHPGAHRLGRGRGRRRPTPSGWPASPAPRSPSYDLARQHSTARRATDATLVALGARRARPDARAGRDRPPLVRQLHPARTAPAGRSGAAGPARPGMPAFPPGRPAPGYPRVGGRTDPSKADDLGPGHLRRSPGTRSGPRGCWTSAPHDGGAADQTAARPARRATACSAPAPAQSGATVYAIAAVGGRRRTHHRGRPRRRAAPAGLRHLPGARRRARRPSSTSSTARPASSCAAAAGWRRAALHPATSTASSTARPDMRRVVAREHTSLLDRRDAARLRGRLQGRRRRPAGAQRAGRHPDAGDGHRHRRPVRGDARLAAAHRRVLPAAGRPRRAAHRQRAQPRLRHRPRRAAAQARRPAVGDQRRGPPTRDLPAAPRRSCAASTSPTWSTRLARDPRRGRTRSARPRRSGRRSPAPSSATSPHCRAATPDSHLDRFLAAFDGLADDRRRGAARLGAPRRRTAAPASFAGPSAQTASAALAARPSQTLKRRLRPASTTLLPELSSGRARRPPPTTTSGRCASAQAARKLTRGTAGAPARRVLDRRPRGARRAAELHAARRRRRPRRRRELDRPGHRRFQTEHAQIQRGASDTRSASSLPAPPSTPAATRSRSTPSTSASTARRSGRGCSARACGYGARHRPHRRQERAPGDLPALRQRRHRRHRPAARRRRADPRHRRDPP